MYGPWGVMPSSDSLPGPVRELQEHWAAQGVEGAALQPADAYQGTRGPAGDQSGGTQSPAWG